MSGWRAIVPADARGYLQINLRGYPAIALPVVDETPLVAHVPLIRVMLAQGGPDAQVDLRIIVGGDEGRRLEVRRYEDNAVVQNGVLRVGLMRDVPPPPLSAFAKLLALSPLDIRAVDLSDPHRIVRIDAATSCDLNEILGGEAGPWLVQSALTAGPRRAAFFAPKAIPTPASNPTRHATPGARRETRIAAYAKRWNRLMSEPGDPEWDRLWMLIQALAEGGDPGVADEVQALGGAPALALMLALRVRRGALADALALDMAAPIFWPALPVEAFVAAVRAELVRQQERLIAVLEEGKATEEAGKAVLRRIGEIWTLRPSLAHISARRSMTPSFSASRAQRKAHLP